MGSMRQELHRGREQTAHDYHAGEPLPDDAPDRPPLVSSRAPSRRSTSTFSKFIGRLEADGKVEPGLTMHGLRHTPGMRLKEEGADDCTIADGLAQSGLLMARHYCRLANTSERDRKLIGSAKIFGERAKRKSSPDPENRSDRQANTESK